MGGDRRMLRVLELDRRSIMIAGTPSQAEAVLD